MPPDESANPYASPQEHSAPQPQDPAVSRLTRPQQKRLEIGEVIVAWEKRRVTYNVILAVVSAPILLYRLASAEIAIERMGGLVTLAILANLCYCAAPVVEGYWTWIVGPTRWMRNLLFLVGTALACLLAVVVSLEMVP